MYGFVKGNFYFRRDVGTQGFVSNILNIEEILIKFVFTLFLDGWYYQDDEFEELHDYESLKNYFNVGLHDIAKELDEENLEKIEKFRDDFTEKYLSHIDVEKN